MGNAGVRVTLTVYTELRSIPQCLMSCVSVAQLLLVFGVLKGPSVITDQTWVFFLFPV